MAKIIVDIGLPKTGSTTRQLGLFSTLHKDGFIHYLGRNSTWHKENKVKEEQRMVLTYWQTGIDFKMEELSLDSNKVNVISNERFTRIGVFSSNVSDHFHSPHTFPALLFNKFKEHDVYILFFLRNQTSFLYSEYTNAYASSENLKNPKTNTLQKFSFPNGDLNPDLIEAGDFGSLMEKYVQLFGKDHVKCLLFEDLKNDAPNFYKKLAEILDVDPERVKRIFEESHFKKKEKKGSNYEVRSHTSSKASKSILKVLNKSLPGLMQYVKGVFKKVKPAAKETVIIADFTTEQKEKIKEIFFESNMKLVEMGLVTKEGLEKNGYL